MFATIHFRIFCLPVCYPVCCSVLCECDTGLGILREENKLQVFRNRLLRNVFQPYG
jgi:hypothetical protein